MIGLFVIFFFASAQAQFSFSYQQFNPKYEPWAGLIEEQKTLKTYAKVNGLRKQEYDQITNKGEYCIWKVVIGNLNYTEELDNKTSIQYETLDHKLTEAFKGILGSSWDGLIKILDIEPLQDRDDVYPMASFYIESESLPNDVEADLKTAIFINETVGEYIVRNGSVHVYKSVEKMTVYEMFIQLYNEPFTIGMYDKNSRQYSNMSDQMQHLVGTAFEAVFGEAYYRIVVLGFGQTKRSTVVRCAVLLDPNQDNFYHSTNMWYSVDGFVLLGKYPLLPGNIELQEANVVLKEFHEFLNDRTYKRPLAGDNYGDRFVLVTIPAFFGLMILIIGFLATLRICHWMAYERREKK